MQARQKRKKVPFSNNPIESAFLTVLLVAIICLVFWPVLQCGFINFDDPLYASENPRVLGGLTLENVRWAFQTGTTGNWHPLTWISLMFNVSVFGSGPGSFHAVNLALHAVNTVLVLFLLTKMTGAFGPSLFVAAIFGLHPLHVESVAWISERKDVLSTFFSLLTLWSYLGYVTKSQTQRYQSKMYYLLALLLFLCGLLSKPMIVTLPFVMLLLDFWPLARWSPFEQRRGILVLFREKLPFFLLAFCFCFVAFIAQKESGAVQPLDRLTFAARTCNAAVSYVRYIGKAFWPVDLAIFYPHPIHWPTPEILFAFFVIIFLSILVFGFGRRMPFLMTGWLWFLGTLVPVIGLVQVGAQSLADRYTYFPLIGFTIATTWLVATQIPRQHHRLLVAFAAIILFACAVETRKQLDYWKNSETVFKHALAVTQNNYSVHKLFAAWLIKENRVNEAVDHYQRALEIEPNRPLAYTDLGNALAAQSRVDEAIELYRRAITLDPKTIEGHNNLGVALVSKGEIDEAIEHYRQVIALSPESAETHDNWGVALARQGRLDDAVSHYRLALQFNPNDPRAHNNLANALIRQGKVDEAISHYLPALAALPNSAEINNNLGVALAQKGNTNEAVLHFQKALHLRPDYEEPKQHLLDLGIRPTP